MSRLQGGLNCLPECDATDVSSLASTWITAPHKPRRQSMEKESDCRHLAGKALDSGAGPRDIRPHGHEVGGVAVRARLSCWAFWSGPSVIHVQGTISQHAAIQSFDCFLRLSVVCHFHECKPARQPSVAIHDDVNLHHLPSKLLVRHLGYRFPTKRFFTTFP